MDVFDKFKAMQREGWAHFAPLQAMTTEPAARFARFAGIKPGHRVLDVACGTGVVAITAARHDAHVTAGCPPHYEASTTIVTTQVTGQRIITRVPNICQTTRTD